MTTDRAETGVPSGTDQTDGIDLTTDDEAFVVDRRTFVKGGVAGGLLAGAALGGAGVAGGASSVTAPFNLSTGYLSYSDGITGQSISSLFPGSSDVLGFSIETPGPRNDPFTPVTIRKRTDTATPDLLAGAAAETVFSRFEVAFYGPNPDSGETMLGVTYRLVEPTVVSVRTSFEPVSQLQPAPVAVDDIVLVPSRIEVVFAGRQPVVLS